jgi:hypothetical protein
MSALSPTDDVSRTSWRTLYEPYAVCASVLATTAINNAPTTPVLTHAEHNAWHDVWCGVLSLVTRLAAPASLGASAPFTETVRTRVVVCACVFA